MGWPEFRGTREIVRPPVDSNESVRLDKWLKQINRNMPGRALDQRTIKVCHRHFVTELISSANSSKEDEFMSSKVQRKTRKGLVKKKTTITASSKNKIQSKFKLKDNVKDGDSGGSSSDERFLEEFESNGSDFSSSSDSDDLSQEFSDEDRLMDYYEKKLREHAIVGFNSDFTEDSDDPPQELRKLVDETFKARPPARQDQAKGSTISLAKKAVNDEMKPVKLNKREQAKFTTPSGKLQLRKGITTAQKSPNTIKVNMKSVMIGLKSREGAAETKGLQPKNAPSSKRANSAEGIPVKKVNNIPASVEYRKTGIAAKQKRKLLNPLDLVKPDRARSQAFSEISSQQNFEAAAQSNARLGSSYPEASYLKVVDYLARIKHMRNSISEINQKINKDVEDAADHEILKSARTAILEQRDRNKKSTQLDKKSNNGVSTSASNSLMASENESAFNEKRLKDEVVDQILNATLGVS